MLIRNIAQYLFDAGHKDIMRIECFIVLLAVVYGRRFKKELFSSEEGVFLFKNSTRKRENSTDFYIPLIRALPKGIQMGDAATLRSEHPELVEIVETLLALYAVMSTAKLRSFILKYCIVRSENERAIFYKD